jgi:hypothetical protein
MVSNITKESVAEVVGYAPNELLFLDRATKKKVPTPEKTTKSRGVTCQHRQRGNILCNIVTYALEGKKSTLTPIYKEIPFKPNEEDKIVPQVESTESKDESEEIPLLSRRQQPKVANQNIRKIQRQILYLHHHITKMQA